MGGAVVDNGALTISPSANATWAGGFSGSGSFTESGAGTLTIDGPVTLAKGVMLKQGGLTLTGDVSEMGTVRDNGALSFDTSGALAYGAEIISGTGSVTFAPSAGGTVSSSVIVRGNASFYGSAATLTYSGELNAATIGFYGAGAIDVTGCSPAMRCRSTTPGW